MSPGKPNPLREAALAFAERGWPVLPCHNATKRPLVAALKGGDGKPVKGTGGLSKASTDPEQIREWWRKWPFAMIGVAMGRNGLFALDFDPRVIEETDPETGEISTTEFTLEQLKADTEAQIGAALPATLGVRTPSGGVHLYYRQPEEGPAINNRGNLPDHVDVRGAGGYVIVPPSFLEDGRAYRWLHGASQAAIAEAPAELIAELRARKRKAPADIDGSGHGGRGAGQTNNAAADQAAPDSSSSRSRSSSADDPGEAAVRRYALAALDEETRLLAATPLGNRNNQANASGFVMGQLVGAGALSRATVRAALVEAVQGFNDPDKAAQAIDNGLDAGESQPRDLASVRDAARHRADRGARRSGSSRTLHSGGQGMPSSHGGRFSGDGGGRGDGPGGEGEDPGEINRRCAFLPQTDLGNLERFLARYGRDFLYVEQWGWLAWDGRRWNREMAVPLLGRAVQRTMRQIQDEAAFIRDTGSDPDEGGLDYLDTSKSKPVLFSARLGAWGRTSESSGHINAIPKLAESRLSARTGDFDADPLKLNVENGTIEFARPEAGETARGRRREHRREDLITKMAEVDFDPAAECARFDAFLEEVQPDEEMRTFLDVWAGYNMLGLADAQKMAVFHGQGSNGKGVWIQTIAHILGDYAWAAAIETFIDQGRYRKGSDASPDLAALAGRRMVYANEPEENAKFSDGLIKAMTSDEPIGGVRELMKPPFELLVTFTNTVSANHRPKIGTDHGIQRRMQLIPWDVIIPDDRADPQLKNKLKAEASGIFNRMIRGAIQYLTTGLPKPEAVVAATKEYLEENDLLGQFIALVVVDAPGEKIGATDLHKIFAAWQTWANQLPANGRPWSAKYLNGQMQRKGYRILKSSTMQWQDIATRYEEGDFVDFEGKARTELPAPRRAAASSAADPPVDDEDDEDDDSFIPEGGR